MPRTEVTISIGVEWLKEEGDGTPCYHCADASWMSQFRLFMVFDGKHHPQDTVLCQSCGEDINADD